MTPARRVETTYLVLLLLHTLAASTIWGINTLFLLDAGLTNAQAFGANAFFAAGLVLFEVPTGVLADTRGRRASYLLGTVTLIASTLLYVAMWRVGAPFWAWALGSMMLGPVRQAYLNGLIPSAQRATVISFDALLTSGGGAIVQPALGRMADVWSYPASYLGGAAIQTLALPFLWLARRERAESDPV